MAPKREPLNVPGLSHTGNFMPMGIKMGNLIFTSAVMGINPVDGALSVSFDEQATQAFQNLRTVLTAAGAGPENLAHITIWLSDQANRAAANKPWVAMFPDGNDRPVRHTVKGDLPEGMLIQLEAIAVL